MATLPPSTDFTDAAVTEGQFKTAISQQRTFLADLLGTNGTNVTALATLGAMFGSLLTRNANHTVVLGDRGKIIQCTGTIEIAFTTASTLGSSFSFVVVNAGSGTVTLNPAGSETIDGNLTLTLSQSQSVIVYCDGSNFRTIGKEEEKEDSVTLLATANMTGSNTITISGLTLTDYKFLQLSFYNVNINASGYIYLGTSFANSTEISPVANDYACGMALIDLTNNSVGSATIYSTSNSGQLVSNYDYAYSFKCQITTASTSFVIVSDPYKSYSRHSLIPDT